MKEFMFLFRGGDARRLQEQKSPELWQQHMMKWKAWMDSLAKKGQLNGGQPLTMNGKVVRENGKQITDGPFAEGKEVIGGYLLVKAADLNEAIDLSKNCPIFEHSGFVEVREIQELNM
ncbi:hypothetical protein HUU42_07050 [bacterium]|nr:hypothetical protein [bacterium]